MAILPRHGRKPVPRCAARPVYDELLPKYGKQLRLICPAVQRVLSPSWRFYLPSMPKSIRDPIAQMAWRIFAATDAIGKMTLDEETVELWAHDPALLDSYLEPIRRDLDALPIRVKAHPSGSLAEEAKHCREAISELKRAAAGYNFAPASHACVYLMPPDSVLSPACWAEQTFYEWRTMGIADRNEKGLGVEAIEFCRLSNTYPMDVITAARKVTVAVRPIMDAFTEAETADGNGPGSMSLPISQGATNANVQPLEWDVFISHASEDKKAFVRPLADALRKEGVRVWLDELILTVGDSLRRRIEEGLARSRYAVVVISPDFMKKEWPQKELDGLFSKETDGHKVILPVWHNVDAKTVQQHIPMLAGKLAASTDKGIDRVVGDLMKVLRP